jgi:hypothetical protein
MDGRAESRKAALIEDIVESVGVGRADRGRPDSADWNAGSG